MKTVTLTVNGAETRATVEARTSLADFLREELLLTGAHLGCEQGVCGACTVLIDGAPARSCITLAVACDGAAVRTIEDFDDDPRMAQLRAAFTREHALQCGFCTPGMLMTAWDIARRLPQADDARIRRELSGNLCRCTGYIGIVRAVRAALGEAPPAAPEDAPDAAPKIVVETPAPKAPEEESPKAPEEESPMSPAEKSPTAPEEKSPEADARKPPEARGAATPLPSDAPTLRQSLTVAHDPARVWALFRDVEAVAACMPGVTLSAPPQADRVEGRIAVRLGPISAAFEGTADLHFDDDARTGLISGQGRDAASGSTTRGEIRFRLVPENGGTRVEVSVVYALSGALGQFARAGIVTDIAARLTEDFAANLRARLEGGEAAPPAREIAGGTLFLRALWAYIRRLVQRLVGGR